MLAAENALKKKYIQVEQYLPQLCRNGWGFIGKISFRWRGSPRICEAWREGELIPPQPQGELLVRRLLPAPPRLAPLPASHRLGFPSIVPLGGVSPVVLQRVAERKG